MRTRFTEAYELSTPIAQAGMAFVGMSPHLAVAVSRAGALGALGVGILPVPAMNAAVAGIRAGTAKPFHVNLITPFATPAHVDALCATAPAAVSFHWGHPPREWLDRLHTAGVRVFEQVGSVDDALRAVDDGVDVVVAQGREAGGHCASALPTFVLVPAVVDAVGPALVLAAGGISDGRGLAAALMLGADGVFVGTRFVATHESTAHDGYKARLVRASGADTVSTSLFGPEQPAFNPMRVLRTKVVREWHDRVAARETAERPTVGQLDLNGERMQLRRFDSIPPTTMTTGDLEEMALPAGQGVGLVDRVLPAATVVAEMTARAEELLGHGWGNH
ncbi:2-nitropropane dioxygenase [Virgisporangium aliadipatigenens]|uniref:2-nitropropane dioxygenase n=1 Tax=Virgisporangium aliadipatigenens TaxID=741659 RepID=A0A8J3YSR5_9ACTN|nr:2-nitropropane dioxygenase [Virgisporangium aliadipatigenens]